MSKKNLIIILGPTAVGKTSLAIEIAKEFGTEIISADSRQFFREMNIGTAKPNEEQLKQVNHHFINSLSAKDEYNAGMFERDTLKVLDKIYLQKNIAVMVGGSGLYINAVCNGFDEVPEADKKVREKLTALYKEKGIEALQTLLKKHDEEHFRKVDIKNPHRLIRAIEVCMVSGKPYSEIRKGKNKKRNFICIKIGLSLPREKLYERINTRVDTMMSEGLLEEVKSLASAYGEKARNLNSLQTVGYKELFEYLEGKQTLAHAVELIKQNTRNFAKRQMTWFRKDKEIKWFGTNEQEEINKYICEKIKNQ